MFTSFIMIYLHTNLDHGLVALVKESGGFCILRRSVAMVTTGSHSPRKLQRFPHSERGSVDLLLVHVVRNLAHKVLAGINRVAVVKNFSF